MSHQSKKAIASTVINTLAFIILYYRHCTEMQDKQLIMQAWGIFFVKLFVVFFALNIITLLLFNLISNMVSKHKAPLITDERDRLIELKSIRVFCFIFTVGFFLAMVTLAAGAAIEFMFITLSFSLLAADILSNLSYIFYYERGY